MAHPRRFQSHLDLAPSGFAELDLLDRPRLVEIPDECAFGLHRPDSVRMVSMFLTAATSTFPVAPRGMASSESTSSQMVGILNELSRFRAATCSRSAGPSPITTAPTRPATSVTKAFWTPSMLRSACSTSEGYTVAPLTLN